MKTGLSYVTYVLRSLIGCGERENTEKLHEVRREKLSASVVCFCFSLLTSQSFTTMFSDCV